MCTKCIGDILVGKKVGLPEPILATMILKYFSEIVELKVSGSLNYLPS
jgi:hypothetical protein